MACEIPPPQPLSRTVSTRPDLKPTTRRKDQIVDNEQQTLKAQEAGQPHGGVGH